MYLLVFPNFVRDECTQNVLLSFGQTFFHRVSHFLSSSVLPATPRNFVFQIGHYENIVSNLFGVNLVGSLCIFFCVFFVLICFIILFNIRNQQSLPFFRKIIRAFIFRAPLRILDAVYMPVCLFCLVVFSDFENMQVGDIIFAFMYSLLLIGYLWMCVFLLNSYLHFYIDYNFLRRFGGLYEHMNFFSTSQAAKILNNKILKFSDYKAFNLIRNHSNFQKISAFAKSLVIIMTTNFSSQMISLIILLVLIIVEFLIFVILKKNEKLYYYTNGADRVNLLGFISLVICYLLMLINSITSAITQIAGIVVLLALLLNYLVILGYGIYELAKPQTTDFLWKIKMERVDLSRKKENYITLLKQYEDGDKDGNGISDKYKEKFNVKRAKKMIKRKEMEAKARGEIDLNFVTNKYKLR